MSSKQLLGLFGSLTLMVAVFLPVIKIPVVGTKTFYDMSSGEGKIVLGLAVLSLILVVMNKYVGLWITGLVSLGLNVLTFISVQNRIDAMRLAIHENLENNPFAGIGELMVEAVQIQWGMAVLFVGSILLICSAAVKRYVVYEEIEETEDEDNKDSRPSGNKLVQGIGISAFITGIALLIISLVVYLNSK